MRGKPRRRRTHEARSAGERTLRVPRGRERRLARRAAGRVPFTSYACVTNKNLDLASYHRHDEQIDNCTSTRISTAFNS